MKKQIVIAVGLAVLSTSAYATKARMQALGQHTENGSHYVQDTRNIFRNAALVNNFKNYVVTEWGTSNSDADSEAAPHAEGGFFREMGAFAYGLYLGNEADAQNAMRKGGSGFAGTGTYGEAGLLSRDNTLDLFFGGDMGIQWGAKIHYAAANNETTGSTKKENSAFGLGLGMVMGHFEASVNLGLSDESKVGDADQDKFDNTGLDINVGYELGDLTLYTGFDKDTVKYTNGTVAEIKTEKTVILAGVAKTHEVSSTARVIVALEFMSKRGKDTDAAGATTERNDTALPLAIAFESEANSWLTLRGSVSAPIIINTRETKTAASTTKVTRENQVGVNAGATLSFGKLKVDGTIGTTGGNRSNGAVNSSQGVLALDNLMARVGVHYWF